MTLGTQNILLALLSIVVGITIGVVWMKAFPEFFQRFPYPAYFFMLAGWFLAMRFGRKAR